MQTKRTVNQALMENLMWFLASLVLALFMWVIANVQLDPVEQWRLPERIPIRAVPDTGLLITNEADLTRSASVLLRAQRSVRSLLAADDVIVWADLTGLGPGEHIVELQWRVAPERRATLVDLSPRQIAVTLEERAERLVPVRVVVQGDAAFGFQQRGEPQPDVNQVLVSGAASQVGQVVEALVEIDLDRQRQPIEDVVRAVPVDADGQSVSEVTVEPQVVRVRVEIAQIGSQ
jgi:YbbR domain-containing protein